MLENTLATVRLLPPLVAVVDDDAGVRGSLDSLLRSEGMRTQPFASARELMQSPLLEEISCVVTDLNMPETDGLALQVWLSERKSISPPIILITAYPTCQARQRALEGGAAAFLTKPVDPDTLLEAIARTLQI
ncbi:response regulator [Novosphingobium sp. BW1]|nr:response regulator [Novosphingobium sp. BW1]